MNYLIKLTLISILIFYHKAKNYTVFYFQICVLSVSNDALILCCRLDIQDDEL